MRRGPHDSWLSAPGACAVIGMTAGLLNGLIALGGGIIVTPLLVGYRGVPPKAAVGTSLAVVVVLSSLGFASHYAMGGLNIGLVPIGLAIVGGMLGSLLAARVLARFTPRFMLILFGGFVFLVALRLIAQGLGVGPDASVARHVPATAFFLLGAMSGALSALFGVGGGALVLLALAVLYGLPVQQGLPIALALNVSNALFGVVTHLRAGRILWPEVRQLIPAALVGVVIGAWLALRLPPDILRVIFGGFFLFLGTTLVRRAMRLG